MYIGLLTAFTWSGASYRAPYEPHLLALAAVVLAGGWRRPPKWALVAAGAAALWIAWAVQTSLPATARGRAEYGIAEWWVGEGGRKARAAGDSGFTVVPVDDQVQLTVVPWAQPAAGDPVRIRMRVEGRPVQEVVLSTTEQRLLAYPWREGPAFVELDATTVASGRPVPYRIRVITRPVPEHDHEPMAPAGQGP
jgi:hypothetical protein